MVYNDLLSVPNNNNALFTNIDTNKFLNIVSDSTQLHNRIYRGHRITHQLRYYVSTLFIHFKPVL